MDSTEEVLATFFRDLSRAALEVADRLHVALPADGDDPAEAPEGLGSRQHKVYSILAEAKEDGLTTGAIAKAMEYEVPNTYLTLQSLMRNGLVELISGSRPQRWRLRRRRSDVAARYLRAASEVRHGEWATYGDIAIAVTGKDDGAIAVGRLASTTGSEFPTPHRILKAGGVIDPLWHDDDGQGPSESRRRLEAEGVTFLQSGRANGSQRVSWEVLRERLRDAGVSVPSGPDA